MHSGPVLTDHDFASVVKMNKLDIERTWIAAVQRHVPAARDESVSFIRDHIPQILNRLIDVFGDGDTRQDFVKGMTIARSHGFQRSLSPDYNLSNLAQEFALLRETILDFSDKVGTLSSATLRLFSRFIEGVLLNASEQFLAPILESSSPMLLTQDSVLAEASRIAGAMAPEQMKFLEGHKYALDIALSNAPLSKLIGMATNELEMVLGNAAAVNLSYIDRGTVKNFAPSLPEDFTTALGAAAAKLNASDPSSKARQLSEADTQKFGDLARNHGFASTFVTIVPTSKADTFVISTICYPDAHTLTVDEQTFINLIHGSLGVVIDRNVERLDRDSAEAKLKRSSDELTTMLKSIGDGVISVSAKPGNPVLFMNRVAEALTGYSLEEALGKPLLDVFHIINKTTRTAAKNPVEAVLSTQTVQLLDKDTLLIAKDGTELEIDDSAAPIQDDRGTITGVVLVFRDVTEHKILEDMTSRAQRDVALEKQKLLYLVDNAIAGMCIFSGPEHIFEYVNDEYVKVIGSRDYLGQKVRGVVPEAIDQGLIEILDTVYQTGQPYVGREFKAYFSPPKGAKREGFFDFVFQPLKEGDKIVGTTVMFIEVTEKVGARVESENQKKWLYSVLDALPVSLILTDPKVNRIKFVNKTGLEMFPIHLSNTLPGERHGAGKVNFYDAHDALVPRDEIPSERACRGESLNGEEYRVEVEDKEFHVATYTRTIPAAYGHDDEALLLMLDISERKKAEIETRARDAIFQATFTHSSVGLALTDLNGRFQEVNHSFEKVAGRFVQDLKAFSVLDITHVDDVMQKRMELDRLINGEVSSFQIEKRYVQPDKNEVWVKDSVSLNRDANGKPTNIILVTEDISNQRKYEENLQRSERRFRTLADAMPQIVWTARPDGVLDYFNLRASGYLGHSQPERWLDGLHTDDVPRVLPVWMHCLETGDDYQVEFRILRDGDQTYRWHLVRAHAVYSNAGAIERWYGTCTDISDSKELAREKEDAYRAAELANTAKSVFLANMSHEIRTPLGAIMGFVELLKDEDLSRDDTHSYLGVIERNSTQLLRIIDDILDLSKVEAGKMLIENINFSLLEVLAEFSSLMGFKARESGIDFKVMTETEIPDPVNSDPTRMRQILNNVVGNAIKFTRKGSVELCVRYEAEILTFRVKDSGRGISPEQAAELFQPFSQADVSTTRKFGGTGLGLVLTKKLCETMGGDFWLEESELGKGSTFIAHLRVAITKDSKMIRGSEFGFTTVPARSRAAANRLLEAMRVLVVEDSPDNQLLLRVLLTRAGATVVMASDGAEGVKKALSEEFDVVVMDVQMPRMDGYAAVMDLRAKGFTKPVIALTAHAMKEERERCLAAGYTDFLSKPIDQTALINMITELRV
ncbi:MAG: PAS domain S-box protein [Chitinophagaceae bacterium]|nr:PAS domain S-box protein [Oligoflexus sp.]